MQSEEWRDVVGFEGLYKVSSLGRVLTLNYKNSGRERVLAVRLNTKGYQHYILYKNNIAKSKKGHRITAEAFIPNPDNKPQVNHKNGIKADNRIENLEWCTNRENSRHSFDVLGRKNISGQRHHKTKLDVSAIEFIRENPTISSIVLARKYGVVKSSILRVRNFKSHVS